MTSVAARSRRVSSLKTGANTPAIVAATTIGFMVPVVPLGAVLDAWWLLAVVAAEAIVASFLQVRRLAPTADTHAPRPPEFAVAAMGAMFPAVVLTISWLLVYAFLRVVVDLFAGDDAARTTGLVVASVLGFFFTPFYARMAAERIGEQLYPDVAGIRSEVYRLVTRPWMVLGLAAAVVAVAAGAAAVDAGSDLHVIPWCVALVVMFQAGSYVYYLGTRIAAPDHEIVAALVRGFELTGLHVTTDVRSEDAHIAPFLSDVDLVVACDDCRWAVSVKSAAGSVEEPSWTDAMGVQAAARALTTEPAPPVEPVLVVTGGDPSELLKSFCMHEHVRMVTLDAAATRHLTSVSGAELRAMVEDRFSFMTTTEAHADARPA